MYTGGRINIKPLIDNILNGGRINNDNDYYHIEQHYKLTRSMYSNEAIICKKAMQDYDEYKNSRVTDEMYQKALHSYKHNNTCNKEDYYE